MVRNRILLALALPLLLAGCLRAAPGPRPTAAPPAPAPAPTATPRAAALRPALSSSPGPTPAQPIVYQPQRVLAADRLLLESASWSPDSRWVGYWVGDPSPDEAPGAQERVSPGFYDTRTGRHCPHPELAGDLFPVPGGTRFVGWEADGQITVVRDGRWFRGRPCGEFARIPAGDDPREVETYLSPDGRYRAETTFDEAGQLANVTLADVATGAVVNRASWQWSLRAGTGQWAGGEHYLVAGSADRGPLLLDVSGEVVEVLPALFAAETSEAQRQSLVAYGAQDQATGSLHLLLEDTVRGDAPLLLYHGETGVVETLAFNSVWGIREGGVLRQGFSPDGGWLTLRHPFGSEGVADVPWLRAVDGERTDIFAAGDPLAAAVGDGASRIAVEGTALPGEIELRSFPDGALLQHWRYPDYRLRVIAWSPDGTRLLMAGRRVPAAAGRRAIFIAAVGPPPR